MQISLPVVAPLLSRGSLNIIVRMDPRAGPRCNRLFQLATTDQLTGTWNRRHIEAELLQEIERCCRYGNSVSLLLLDVDNFKHINDKFGHQTGDIVLKELTRCVQANLRQLDRLGRWRGEEFLVLMPQCQADDALQLAERQRAVIADQPFADVGTITASFGVAQWLNGSKAKQYTSCS